MSITINGVRVSGRGKDGVGVAAGGTVGQILIKRTDTDYDTKWVDNAVSGISDLTVSAEELNLLEGADSNIQEQLNDKVSIGRSINGKTLGSDISLSASDVGALPEDTKIPSIDGLATEEYVNSSMTSFLQTIYPVGSIYLSTNSASPASLFGGTWEQIKDKFLLGAGSTYSAGSTGGEAAHALSVKETPALTGKISFHGKFLGTQVSGTSGVFSNGSVIEGMYGSVTKTTGANSLESIAFDNGGKNQAHNNMPPYLTVYIWKRIS